LVSSSHHTARRRTDPRRRFSVEDKRQIALALDGLGVDYIEGGWPGANPTDTAFFCERPKLARAASPPSA